MSNGNKFTGPHVPIVLPDVRADGEPIRISCWLVDVGDLVECGDRIVEISIRGMTFDVAAPAAGRLTAIQKPVDAAVRVGDQLGILDFKAVGSES